MCGRDTSKLPVKRCLDFDGKREDSNCVTKVCVLITYPVMTLQYVSTL